MMALGLTYGSKFQITCVWNWKILTLLFFIFLYPHSQRGGYVAITLSVCLSVRSHFPLRCLSCYWKKLFYFLQCDLEFFMFAVMKTFVTVISASTGTNDFIFDIWLWHGDLYHVSPFQVYSHGNQHRTDGPRPINFPAVRQFWLSHRTDCPVNCFVSRCL